MNNPRVARVLATWFGCGLVPKAPGTAGSIAALLPAILLGRFAPLDGLEVAFAGALLFGPAVWAAGTAAQEAGADDPGWIVIDEVVGQWIAMAGATHLNWKSWLFGFLLFRTFDITKPFPIRRLEHLPDGLGIVADDALAGVYVALVLFLMGWFNLY